MKEKKIKLCGNSCVENGMTDSVAGFVTFCQAHCFCICTGHSGEDSNETSTFTMESTRCIGPTVAHMTQQTDTATQIQNKWIWSLAQKLV